MKCEECLPLIEEYVDGELDGRMIERLTAHLKICAPCENELMELKRDAEIYARYQRDIEVTPAQWNIVRARIEQEKDALTAATRTRRLAWLAGGMARLQRRLFRPALVAALALIAIGLTAGIIYLNSRSRQTHLASESPKRNEPNAPREEKRNVTTDKVNEDKEAVAQDESVEQRDGDVRQVAKAGIDDAPNSAGRKRAATARASLQRSVNRLPKGAASDKTSPFDEAATAVDIGDNLMTDARQNVPEFSPDFNYEVARHAERAEMLLRSFRNARPARRTRTLDVAYEKQQSRKLLYQNIALRRDAQARGDQPASALLNALEPILLDIANLPDRVKAHDVRSIEQRMEKKEIVAALQVQTLIAAN
jgi:hypothetical protein